MYTPRGPGFQGNMVYSENLFATPSAYYSFTPGSATSTHGSTGGYNGHSIASTPSVLPTQTFAPELVEAPSWYIDSGATNDITNDLGQEHRDSFA